MQSLAWATFQHQTQGETMFKNFMLAVLAALSMALFSGAALAATDINKATQAELESVKGIGPSMSTKILDERKKSAFKNWDDVIDRVKGVGAGNAAKFSADGLTVNGESFKGQAGTGSEKVSAKTKAKAEPKAEKDKAAKP
jgi:competence protein ComEA